MIEAGQGLVRYQALPGQVWRLGPGQGFFAFPNQLCRYEPDPSAPWTYRWVGFSAAAWAEECLRVRQKNT